jgi:hypothetical protein
MLPAFIRFDCQKDEVQEIDPPETPELLIDPEAFGDRWDEPLHPGDLATIGNYFRRIEKLDETLDFIRVRVAEKETTVHFGARRFRRAERGLTLEAPRHSLMTAFESEIFDDLLIGNFLKVTLHGKWGARRLYPDFTPYVAKYGDNGRARSRAELGRYFAEYRRRAPLDHARHLFDMKLLMPLKSASADLARARLGADSPIYRSAKKIFWALRAAI